MVRRDGSRPGVAAAAIILVPSLGGTVQPPKSPTTVRIDQFAVNVAARNGDATPISVTWVATNREAANAIIGAGVGSGASSVLVYAMDIRGRFYVDGPGPPGSAAPSGTYLYVVARRSTLAVTDLGTSDAPDRLSSLGKVETDSLAGIKPMRPVRNPRCPQLRHATCSFSR
ncbi:MAG: hypothetical protein ACLQRH_00215 [Acidimicrobiales bacterium]